ncbi:transcriptional regulator, TetR family [Klenkia marina]|uniref:Transcriptional regulator, TetR family n=1 Tax=Klenkia marina TaxID=1960309 RepID=A0A1G4XEG7_9ACTN|nr:TetR family transcriptional regulator [Klenkia marina]SCX39556.1 transcriptional regulator, TetR family [Klenkia marina]
MPLEIGASIRRLRTARGVSLRALAAGLGVSPATLSAVENGHTGVSAARVAAIADLLGVPVARVFDPDGRGGPGPGVLGPGVLGPGALTRTSAQPAPDPADWRDYGPLQLDPALTAALATFVEVGYHGSTIRTIAAHAGLSVSGLYHYYESKYDMLVALLDRTMVELDARMRAARAEGADPVARVGALVECLALFHSHRRATAFLGASEMRSLRPEDYVRVAAVRRAQQQAVDEEVAAAVAAGQLVVADPPTAARAVVTLCTAIPQWFRPDGPLAPEDLAAQYVGFALALLGRPTLQDAVVHLDPPQV